MRWQEDEIMLDDELIEARALLIQNLIQNSRSVDYNTFNNKCTGANFTLLDFAKTLETKNTHTTIYCLI